ncbi:P-loop NTPase fold protein [Streptomyces sp. NPDC052042]|uniref:KAP family P-loop NTPase fold protein n=1 Tax=Streptomyces sp. NPDC052042 TaxID=3365683 RepID=UPI0037D08062
MWSDNEADVDLLGFNFLVDELMVPLTRPQLLPLTVGLLGEWGSGKSSLLKIVAARLEAERPADGGRYVVVQFSPWQFEGYDDIKIALMDTILKRLQAEAASNASAVEEIGLLRRFINRLRRPAGFAGRAALAGVGSAAQLAATHYQPDLAPLAQAVAQQVATMGAATLDRAEQQPPAEDAGLAIGDDVLADVASFRSRFESLVETLEGVTAVIVLVDDLDRCLPGTIVDTFEGIRVFLHTKKTAYVIAAHPQVVEAAIDRFYPTADRPGATGLGAEYLEKMLQVKITIPVLSAPEAETYMQLLLAQLHLEGADFTTLLNDVAQRRTHSVLAVSLNPGLAADSLGRDRMPPALFTDMGWAGSIAPLLGAALRGNPRQLKRFMNSVIMRRGSAQRRGTDLDAAVLAKLMVLEEQYLTDFQRLFDWQVRGGGGTVAELAAAERHTLAAASVSPAPTRGQRRTSTAPGRSGDRVEETGPAEESLPLDPEVATWAAQPHIERWLRLEPALGGTDLGPYFTYARAKLTVTATAARLPAALQGLLVQLQSEIVAIRRTAVQSVAETVPAEDLPLLMEQLLARVLRDPGSGAWDGAVEVAEKVPSAVAAVCHTLGRIPLDGIPRAKVPSAVRRLPQARQEVTALLDGWQNSVHAIGQLVAGLRTPRGSV